MNKDYIFIHIPRTGGRSIEHVMGIPDVLVHRTISDLIDEYTEPVVRSKFKFTVVRNPWDHAVSYWYYFNMTSNLLKPDFDSWIQWIAEEYPKRKDSKEISLNWDYRSRMDQLDYCRTKSGEILIDYFLKFENLNYDFQPIAEKFDTSPILPKFGGDEKQKAIEKSLTTEDYRDMYKSQKSIDAVASLNKELIERFNYNFRV